MTHYSFENVAVMGAGAVGCYFGAMLARAGVQVRLIGRPALVDAVTREGLRFEGTGFSARLPVSATTDPDGVAGASLVLFSVKSPDTEAAARAIAPHLAPGAVVLGLQNGVDNFERLRAHIANVVVPAVAARPVGAGGPTVTPCEPVIVASALSVVVMVCAPAVRRMTPLVNVNVPASPAVNVWSGGRVAEPSEDMKWMVPW